MENPFELILQKLMSIENMLKNGSQPIKGLDDIVQVFNLDQAADYVSLSKSAIYKKTSEKTIPHFKQGKKLYFRRSELDEWLTQHRVSTNEEIDKAATDYIIRNKRPR